MPIPVPLLMLGLAAVTPGTQEYGARHVGDWTVVVSKDRHGCFLSRQYDGRGNTTMLLGMDVDGGNRLSLLNDNWSIAAKDRLKLTFRLSNRSYADQSAIGIVAGAQRGFVTRFDADFPATFASSKSLNVARGDVPVARLTLDGSGAAVAELRRCVDEQCANGGTDATDKSDDGIPLDPFAPPSKHKRKS